MLTGIPLLHYFNCGNEYSGAHFGMRYHFKPGKETATKEDGTEEQKKVLLGTIWPDPWAEEKTDPALRRHKSFAFTDEGLAEAQNWLAETFQADEEKWKSCPGILDCEPWQPAPESDSTPKSTG